MSTKVEEVKVFLESRHGVYQFESVIIIPSTQRHRMLQNLLIDGTEFPTLDNDEIGEFVVKKLKSSGCFVSKKSITISE